MSQNAHWAKKITRTRSGRKIMTSERVLGIFDSPQRALAIFSLKKCSERIVGILGWVLTARIFAANAANWRMFSMGRWKTFACSLRSLRIFGQSVPSLRCINCLPERVVGNLKGRKAHNAFWRTIISPNGRFRPLCKILSCVWKGGGAVHGATLSSSGAVYQKKPTSWHFRRCEDYLLVFATLRRKSCIRIFCWHYFIFLDLASYKLA